MFPVPTGTAQFVSLPRLVSDLNRERPHAYHASGCCPSACLIPDRQASLPIHAKANNWAFAAVCTAHACPSSTAAAIYCSNASITCSSYKATSHAAVGCPEALSFVIHRNLLICSNLVLLQSVPVTPGQNFLAMVSSAHKQQPALRPQLSWLVGRSWQQHLCATDLA